MDPRLERLTRRWSGPVAGFQFHQGATVADDPRPGHLLLLVREPDNAYDDGASAVYSASTKPGHVPRQNNAVLATMRDSREYHLLGKVDEVAPAHRNPWERRYFSICHVRQAGDQRRAGGWFRQPIYSGRFSRSRRSCGRPVAALVLRKAASPM